MQKSHWAAISALLLVTACASNEEESVKVTQTVPDIQESNMMRLAATTRAAGDYASAERIYLDVIRENKTSTEAHLALAETYVFTKQFQRAVNVLQDAATRQPEDVNIQIELANALIHAGEATKAVTHAEKAIALDSGNPRAYNTKGVALDSMGKYTAAQSAYLEAIKLNPEAVYIKNNLALSYIMSDKYDKAIAILAPLNATQQATPTVRQNLALAYGLKGDTEKALSLSMKDLPEEKARENLAFYKQFAGKRKLSSGNSKTVDTAVTPVSAKELFAPEFSDNDDTISVPEKAKINSTDIAATSVAAPSSKPIASPEGKAVTQSAMVKATADTKQAAMTTAPDKKKMSDSSENTKNVSEKITDTASAKNSTVKPVTSDHAKTSTDSDLSPSAGKQAGDSQTSKLESSVIFPKPLLKPLIK